jgi:hypothetical protein
MPPSCMSLYLRVRILFLLCVHGFFIIGLCPLKRIIRTQKRLIFTEYLRLKMFSKMAATILVEFQALMETKFQNKITQL